MCSAEAGTVEISDGWSQRFGLEATARSAAPAGLKFKSYAENAIRVCAACSCLEQVKSIQIFENLSMCMCLSTLYCKAE